MRNILLGVFGVMLMAPVIANASFDHRGRGSWHDRGRHDRGWHRGYYRPVVRERYIVREPRCYYSHGVLYEPRYVRRHSGLTLVFVARF